MNERTNNKSKCTILSRRLIEPFDLSFSLFIRILSVLLFQYKIQCTNCFVCFFFLQTKKKRKRCGECIGCQKKDNCGDCAPCRNDKSHQICKQRRCEKLTDKKVSTVCISYKKAKTIKMHTDTHKMTFYIFDRSAAHLEQFQCTNAILPNKQIFKLHCFQRTKKRAD